MCSHNQALKDAELLLKKFGVRDKPPGCGEDICPEYQGYYRLRIASELLRVRYGPGWRWRTAQRRLCRWWHRG